eukprot:14718291-Alexandrium_andersonii.AAC.1
MASSHARPELRGNRLSMILFLALEALREPEVLGEDRLPQGSGLEGRLVTVFALTKLALYCTDLDAVWAL